MTVSIGIVTTSIDAGQGGDGKTAFGLIELAVSQMHLAQAWGAEKISVSEEGPEPEA